MKAVLQRYDIPVITGIDTRSLVRLLRNGGNVPDALLLSLEHRSPGRLDVVDITTV